MDSFCRFEQQQAKITISKLQCEPYEDKSLKTIVGKLNDTVFGMKSSTDERVEQIETNLDEKFGNLEELLEEKIEKLENASFPLLSPFHCPTLKSNSFQLVENVCYYFEFESSFPGHLSGELPYRDAQQNCQIVFGPHGHLFEPDTPEKSRQIFKLASSMISAYNMTRFATHWWVGVHSIGSDSYSYASSGQPLTMTSEGYGNLTSGNQWIPNQCVSLHKTQGLAQNHHCNELSYSICESKNVKQE